MSDMISLLLLKIQRGARTKLGQLGPRAPGVLNPFPKYHHENTRVNNIMHIYF